MSLEKHPLHIKDPELQKSEDVQNAVEKQERLDGERIPNDPTDRIEAYMDRLENVFLNPDERVRKRNLNMLRDKIYDALIIKPENFPESYFELQQRVARERGQPVEHIPENIREQMKQTAIEDQRHSLDQWIDYLTSDDAMYPTWFKYYVWKNIIKLSQFDKERGEFKKRTSTTVAPYPDIYREPLAQLADLYEKVKEDNKALKDEEVQELFSKKFPSAYAELIQKTLEQRQESDEEIKGEWIKYEHGNSDDAERLYKSLENKGTGWCTAGRSTAQTQIESGDFYVYYTYNDKNEPTQPRIAIRMQDNHIGEVRGVLPHQNLEPIMQPILEDKLKDFGGEAESYKKKSEDMRRLTEIDQKINSDTPLTKEDLIFLYEIDSTIEGFGYERDPRIQELLSQRNSEEDMLTIFDCTIEQVAHNTDEISEQTRAYLGPWNPTVYNKIKDFPNISHLYESFPDKKIFTYELHTNPEMNSPQKAEEILTEQGIWVSDYAKDILSKTEFSLESKTYKLVQFTVVELGFPDGATTDEIYAKAQELDLNLCPAEVGPQLRASYKGRDWKFIAMKQITGRIGYPFVFDLSADGGELGLYGSGAGPLRRWDGSQFVFVSRK